MREVWKGEGRVRREGNWTIVGKGGCRRRGEVGSVLGLIDRR